MLILIQYDHNEFPGVVPRTFVGAFTVSVFCKPAHAILQYLQTDGWVMQLVVRFYVGALVCMSLWCLLDAVASQLGHTTAVFTSLILCSQFHFMFYASRTLPNTFALILVQLCVSQVLREQYSTATVLATMSCAVFRCELVLLYAPVFVPLLLSQRIALLRAVLLGLATVAAVLVLTVPLDSWLWGRWLWPEAQVWYYNVVLNQSHQWGVSHPLLVMDHRSRRAKRMSWHWYFTSALPRALLSTCVFVPVGLWMERRTRALGLAAVCFVVLYSCLPHKELRFVLYAVPVLDICAACVLTRFWQNRHKSKWHVLLVTGGLAHLLLNLCGSFFFLTAAANNYPGGTALSHLQLEHSIFANESRSVHIDVFCAQTGVTRFIQHNPLWRYNKSETLSPSDLLAANFDYMLIGQSWDSLKSAGALLQSYRRMFSVTGFDRLTLHTLPQFPFIWPRMLYTEQVTVLVARKHVRFDADQMHSDTKIHVVT